MLRITDAQRRARLVTRQGLHPEHRFADVATATRTLVALHATDPATYVLSAWARIDGFVPDALDRAVHEERTLVKHMAMRRTLFVVHRDLLPAVQAGASDRVAGQERGRLVRDVEKAGLQSDGAAWLADAESQVLAALAGGRTATASELRAELPILSGAITYGAGKSWGGDVPIGPRVLTGLSAAGQIVRAANDGRWTVSRPRWAAMADWLGAPIPAPPVDLGTRELVAAWLRAFGPGTTTDLKWWLGGTVAAVKRALADLEAVEVQLEGDGTGWLLPDDLEPVDEPAPSAALLPGLDLTTMGWFERDFYLAPHREQLFDRNGNGGPTAWWNGRIVGGWRPAPDGSIELQLLEDPGAAGRRALEAEAARLADWLGDTRLTPRFPSPLSKSTELPDPSR